MEYNNKIHHEIVKNNPDIQVRFFLSEDKGSYIASHWHNSLEMVYMIEGSIKVRCGEIETYLNPNEFNIVNAREIHSVLAKKNKAFVLQVPSQVLEKYIPDYDLIYFKVDMHPNTKKEEIRLQILKDLFWGLYTVYVQRPHAWLLKFNSHLYQLLYFLVQFYSMKFPKKEVLSNEKILNKLKKIMVYIEDNHEKTLSVQDIADRFGYHPDYLTRLFKKYLGMTTVDYLYEMRLKYIYNDLCETDLYVYEILERHGGSNYKLIMKKFKERYGCTPKEKRKKLTGQSD